MTQTLIYTIQTSAGLKVWLGGEPLSLRESLKVYNHSPTGFGIGYRGSGPAQLALAILLQFTDPDEAVRLHQQFKEEFLANPEHQEQSEVQLWVDVEGWIQEHSTT